MTIRKFQAKLLSA